VDALLPSIVAVAREPVGTDGSATRAAALGAIRAYVSALYASPLCSPAVSHVSLHFGPAEMYSIEEGVCAHIAQNEGGKNAAVKLPDCSLMKC